MFESQLLQQRGGDLGPADACRLAALGLAALKLPLPLGLEEGLERAAEQQAALGASGMEW